MNICFDPRINSVKELDINISDSDIEREPMVYGGSAHWTNINGGPLTKAILDAIKDTYEFRMLLESQGIKGYHPVIDTKSVLLMPGWYPCIPGWHCDGVIRNDRNSQPDTLTISEPIQHYTCYFTGDGEFSPTEFIEDPLVLNVNPEEVWKSVDLGVKDALSKGRVSVFAAKPGEIVKFNRSTLHRGVLATRRHWRYFFRLSFYHMPAMNRFRHQVQVYPKDINGGW